MKLLALIATLAVVTVNGQDCPVASDPAKTRYCQIDRYGDISLEELLDAEYQMRMSNDESVFAPNTAFKGIQYDCECEPTCQSDSEYGQIALEDPVYSRFFEDTFRYCFAIPSHALDSHLYFQDADGEEISVFNCESTADAGDDDCNGWRKMPAEESYKHQCFSTYCVDAYWPTLSPHYAVHQDDYYVLSFYGVVVSSSQYEREICHDGDCHPITPLTYTAPNLFTISTPIHVPAHLYDVRVYAPAVAVAYETEHSTVFSEFEWGLDNNVGVLAQITITTQIQAPLLLNQESFVPVNFVGFFEIVELTPPEECRRPAGYELDHQVEQLAPCKQRWLITLRPEYETCQIDTSLEIGFEFQCDETFVRQRGECPFTRAQDTEVAVSFGFGTDNWCDVLSIDLQPPTAFMDSFLSDDCNTKADDFLTRGEYAGFEVYVEGTGSLTVTGSKLHSLHVVSTCGETYNNAAWFVTDGVRQYEADVVSLRVTDVPSTTCAGRSSAETVRFSMSLGNEFFTPPKKASCEFIVWAIIELDYLGFDGQTGSRLLDVQLSQSGTSFGDIEPVNMGSIMLTGKYETTDEAPVAASSASALAVSTTALALIAVPAMW